MRQIITLAIFFMCLFSCAGLVLFFIWAGGPPGERWMQTAATLFVVGLTFFLVWFTETLYRIRQSVAEQRK
ncbi:hypothetical protein A3D62_02280 [Candidatus Kaiserbacteria bacterium RIFCSPHIGHO2_02_FULL_49_11]|uniref:Uncharacterized protein n=1 Tax=Candidatus Kaiserbacteria bacterium RIFCSPHIGHO2_02_FULL_49_11 TaxID=1798489 RepID=A0A1F6D1V3_9BACT|nr:MAG: hypothetical protein A3D62_02280 [Candidatus Kaiserbacteria bacterium RIFCSPHIGHO2_02_FULL_49_11]